jgi:NAD(P)H-flavin reductase
MTPGMDPMTPGLYRVAEVVKETQDTYTLALEPGAGVTAGCFLPGQFSMLYVFGVGEIPISNSSDPAARDRLAFTVRSVGQATQAFVTREPGDTVGVRGPFGACWPLEQAHGKDVVIVAGGIGLAPLRPAIYQVLRNREHYGRLIIFYGVRTPRDRLYRRELAAWARRPDTELLSTVDYGDRAWRGHVGVVTMLFRHVRLAPDRTLAMLCGPEIMMRFAARELVSRGIGPEQIFLSMERNMKCAVGFCGHCQYGPYFICKDGPVFAYPRVRPLLEMHEL